MVGYFILGPSELYKLTKEIGKFIQSFRTLSSEASKSFESTMENQLELQELRKAQSELNNAFSFRRSINVDQEAEAFSEVPPMVDMAEGGGVAAAAAVSATSTEVKKKKKKRRVKRKVANTADDEDTPFTGNIPDLDFSEEFKKEIDKQMMTRSSEEDSYETEDETSTRLRNERLDRLKNGQPPTPPDWYSASESDIASEVLSQKFDQRSPEEKANEQSRFASQLSGNWNDQILANEDKLSPLAKIMERLAILEEEKNAADSRLEEEFRLRAENEEKFYRQKRQLLEEASAEVAASAYDFGTTESVSANGTQTSSSYNFDVK